ncbi:MAG: DMT family transporter [Burkholderiaceae bacterium]|nr:DMT family transporter [Burkholderiaceae bacterium]
MLTGLLCAMGAGLMWGLVFVVPLTLADYPGLLLSFGRYVAFGLIALVPAWFDRKRIAQLSRADWQAALKLSLIGNLIYYAALASAIQLADAPLPAVLVGTLPVVIAACSNFAPSHHADRVSWRRLAPPLLIIFAGLMLVNGSELEHLDGKHTHAEYALGCLLAGVALAAWTWYPIVNARHLKAHPHIGSSTWATAQGLATLPLALAGYTIYCAALARSSAPFALPFGPRPLPFIGLMLTIGLCASWLGTLLWNRAAKLLPTSLAGQLIVFETLFALLYAFMLRGSMPPPAVLAGALLLCTGVMLGMRVFRNAAASTVHEP